MFYNSVGAIAKQNVKQIVLKDSLLISCCQRFTLCVILPWLGGAKRDQLLKDFVCRCYSPADDHNKNKAH